MTAPSGRRLAAERWPEARIVGAGRIAVLGCGEQVTLTSTALAAAAVATRFDRFGCGPGCQRRGHIVAPLNERTST